MCWTVKQLLFGDNEVVNPILKSPKYHNIRVNLLVKFLAFSLHCDSCAYPGYVYIRHVSCIL